MAYISPPCFPSLQISRMEHQQVEHQQLVNIEVIGNSQARALVVKLVNIVLTVLQVVLLIVATLANITMPFLRTRSAVTRGQAEGGGQ